MHSSIIKKQNVTKVKANVTLTIQKYCTEGMYRYSMAVVITHYTPSQMYELEWG